MAEKLISIQVASKSREGDYGTWSHCGKKQPHEPHLHTIVFNEGPYPDIMCTGRGPRPPKIRVYIAIDQNTRERLVTLSSDEADELRESGYTVTPSTWELSS